MRIKPDRKTSKGRTILEETDEYIKPLLLKELCSDTLMLEDVFTDIQMLVCDMLGKLSAAAIDNETIECIYTLQQVCITILEKINTKIQ